MNDRVRWFKNTVPAEIIFKNMTVVFSPPSRVAQRDTNDIWQPELKPVSRRGQNDYLEKGKIYIS